MNRNEKGSISPQSDTQCKDTNNYLKSKALPSLKSPNLNFWCELLRDGVVSLGDLSTKQISELIDFSFFKDFAPFELTNAPLPYTNFGGRRYYRKRDVETHFNTCVYGKQ